MKFLKSQISNIIFILVIAILVIPQTRKPIQVFLSKGMALISPSIEQVEKQEVLSTYDWKLKDEKGTLFNFESTKGKVIIVNFWATWCPPCRHEMPTLDRLQGKLGGENFEVLALSIDRAGPKVVRAFVDRIGVKHLRLLIDETGASARNLGAYGLPVTLLIDPDGAELSRIIGPAEWDTPEMIAFFEKTIAAERAGRK